MEWYWTFIREGDGGAVACCGSFRPDFVTQLLGSDTQITDDEAKTFIKILKAVSGGARKMLRIAAELQLGLNDVNWRQTTMSEFFKPIAVTKRTRTRKDWTDADSTVPPTDNKMNKKNSMNKKNRNISMNYIFDNNKIGNIVYWEIKAG